MMFKHELAMEMQAYTLSDEAGRFYAHRDDTTFTHTIAYLYNLCMHYTTGSTIQLLLSACIVLKMSYFYRVFYYRYVAIDNLPPQNIMSHHGH